MPLKQTVPPHTHTHTHSLTLALWVLSVQNMAAIILLAAAEASGGARLKKKKINSGEVSCKIKGGTVNRWGQQKKSVGELKELEKQEKQAETSWAASCPQYVRYITILATKSFTKQKLSPFTSLKEKFIPLSESGGAEHMCLGRKSTQVSPFHRRRSETGADRFPYLHR